MFPRSPSKLSKYDVSRWEMGDEKDESESLVTAQAQGIYDIVRFRTTDNFHR